MSVISTIASIKLIYVTRINTYYLLFLVRCSMRILVRFFFRAGKYEIQISRSTIDSISRSSIRNYRIDRAFLPSYPLSPFLLPKKCVTRLSSSIASDALCVFTIGLLEEEGHRPAKACASARARAHKRSYSKYIHRTCCHRFLI